LVFGYGNFFVIGAAVIDGGVVARDGSELVSGDKCNDLKQSAAFSTIAFGHKSNEIALSVPYRGTAALASRHAKGASAATYRAVLVVVGDARPRSFHRIPSGRCRKTSQDSSASRTIRPSLSLTAVILRSSGSVDSIVIIVTYPAEVSSINFSPALNGASVM
jgi:hypothetical protein